MPQRKPRQLSSNENIRRRIQKWTDEDPSTLLTKQVEKATAPLQGLVALLLPDRLIHEMIEKTLWAAEALVDHDDIFKTLSAESLAEVHGTKLEDCDKLAETVQLWAVGAAAALGAWDLAGPLGIGPSLLSLFTLSFRTIKKIGCCYGYDTSQSLEEIVALEIFVAASTLFHRDKVEALKNIERYLAPPTALPRLASVGAASPSGGGVGGENYSRQSVEQMIERVAHLVGANLTKRRALAGVPALGALMVGGANAWLIQDISLAARNVYASRRLKEQADARSEASKKRQELAAAAALAEAAKADLPKAA